MRRNSSGKTDARHKKRATLRCSSGDGGFKPSCSSVFLKGRKRSRAKLSQHQFGKSQRFDDLKEVHGPDLAEHLAQWFIPVADCPQQSFPPEWGLSATFARSSSTFASPRIRSASLGSCFEPPRRSCLRKQMLKSFAPRQRCQMYHVQKQRLLPHQTWNVAPVARDQQLQG